MDFLLHAIGWAAIAVAGSFALTLIVALAVLVYAVWKER
jgi:hypothetical protein